MTNYWVLGRMFKEDHDRAIRFEDPAVASRTIKNVIPKEPTRIRPEWCDKCGVYHIIREVQITSVQKVYIED